MEVSEDVSVPLTLNVVPEPPRRPRMDERSRELPEVAALRGVEQPPQFHPEGDVFEHTMLMLKNMTLPTPNLAWSVLLHDVGKVATFSREEITLDLAQRLVDRIVTDPRSEISVPKIQEVVCSYFGISEEVFLSKTRKREIVQARQIAMYLSRNLTKTSLSSIGAQLGGKDHATVLHACNTVGDLMDTDRSFRSSVHDIERQLNTTD